MSLVLALCLDAIFGEPKWLWDRVPHPAVLMGRCVGWLDERLNKGRVRRLRGLLALLILSVGSLGLGALLQAIPGQVVDVIVAAVLLAQKSLVEHVKDVADALRNSVPEGRRMVARIVGRDTSKMDAAAISRAAIESASENFSDGVLAPAFWFAIGGLPGLLLYKITNTADSMIGYRTPRHEAFGWAAARFDDLLNWVPARLTALLIVLSHFHLRDWFAIRKDARLHRSPNAGWPEAAMARVLGISLAGPRSYEGQMRTFPFVNEAARKVVGPGDIDASIAVLWRVWAVLLGGALLVAAL